MAYRQPSVGTTFCILALPLPLLIAPFALPGYSLLPVPKEVTGCISSLARWSTSCPWGTPEIFCCFYSVDVNPYFPMPKKWDRRYVRLGPGHGEEVYVIENAGIASVWTCLRPNQTVSTVKLSGKHGSTTTRVHGVAYRSCPSPNAQGKTAAEQRSAVLKAEGVTGPALVGCAPDHQASRLRRALWMAFSAPALAVAGACWLSGSWYRCLTFLVMVVAAYRIASSLGLTTFMSSLLGQFMAILHAFNDAFYAATDTYAGAQETLDKFNDRFGTEFSLLEFLIGLILVWVYFRHGHVLGRHRKGCASRMGRGPVGTYYACLVTDLPCRWYAARAYRGICPEGQRWEQQEQKEEDEEMPQG